MTDAFRASLPLGGVNRLALRDTRLGAERQVRITPQCGVQTLMDFTLQTNLGVIND